MSKEVNKNLELDENYQQTSNSKYSRGSSTALFFSVLFYFLSIILAIVGLVLAYQDSNTNTAIVGGDAYNYIIFVGRGIAFIVTAVIFSIFGLSCQILHLYQKLEKHYL